MALLKTLTTTASKQHHEFKLNIYYLEPQDIENNTSHITWELFISPKGRYGWSYSSGTPVTYNVVINNQTWSGTILSYDGTTADYYVAGASRIPVAHDVDGSKNLSMGFSISSQDVSYLPGSVAPFSVSAALPKIPRASSFSCPTTDIESTATITINKQDSAFTHTLTYTYGKYSGTIAEKTTSSKVSFPIPSKFYTEIPNGKTGQGTIKCDTIYNGKVLGTKSAQFTVTTNEAKCAPTLAPKAYVPADSFTASLTGSTTKFIKGYTSVTVETGGAIRNYATMINQRITCGSKSVANVEGKGTISKVSSNQVTYRAYDSRGYLTEKTATIELVDYVKPTCSITEVKLSTSGELELTISGQCFNDTFGAKSNEIVVSYHILEEGNEYISWRVIEPKYNNNSYTATVNLTGLDYQKTYSIEASIKDTLTSYVYATEKKINTTPVFDWGENDFNFNVPVTIKGVELDYIVEQDTKDGWYYRKWNSGLAECWQTFTDTAAQTKNLNGMYYSDADRVDLPFTFKEVVYVSATGGATANMNIVRPFAHTTTYVSWCVVGAASLASPTVRVNLEVKGRWK